MAEIRYYPLMGEHVKQHTASFGERLRQVRTQQDLTAKELSQLTGVPEKTIYRIETGEVSDPRLSTLIALLKGLNCSADELIYPPEDFPKYSELRQVFLKFGELNDHDQEFLLEVMRRFSLAIAFEKVLNDSPKRRIPEDEDAIEALIGGKESKG